MTTLNIDTILARSFRTRFVFGFLVAAGFGAIAAVSWLDWTREPALIDHERLAKARTPRHLPQDQCIVESTRWLHTPWGEHRDDDVVAEVVALPIGERLLLAKVKPGQGGRKLQGRFIKVPDELRSQDLAAVMPDIPADATFDSLFFPVMLDAANRERTWLVAVVLGLVALLALGCCGVALAVKLDPRRGAIGKRLLATGDHDAAKAALDRELVDPDTLRFGKKLFITANWVVAANRLTPKIIAIDDIVWAYRKQTTTLVALIPIMASELTVVDDQKRKLTCGASAREVDAAVEALGALAPWAAFGYSHEMMMETRRNWTGVKKTVADRKKRLAARKDQRPRPTDGSGEAGDGATG